MVVNFLEFSCCFAAFMRLQVCLAAHENWVQLKRKRGVSRGDQFVWGSNLERLDSFYRILMVERELSTKRRQIIESNYRIFREEPDQIVRERLRFRGIRGHRQCQGRRVLHIPATRTLQRRGSQVLRLELVTEKRFI